MSSASVKDAGSDTSGTSLNVAREIASGPGRRRAIPIRNSFVRNDDPSVEPPLARLVSRGGRGGAVPIKLYVALIWRCSASPFDTEISARKWALLLDLNDPNGLGARRVTKAMAVLEDERLVKLDRRRGDSTVVTLLEESGSGSRYSLPSTAYQRAKSPEKRAANRYFKVPLSLWTEGYLQHMPAAAVAMLLVLLAERNKDGKPTWWSTERFPDLFGLSPTTRSKGTQELRNLELLEVTKQLVAVGSSTSRTFVRERVRNLYQLTGAARPQDDDRDDE